MVTLSKKNKGIICIIISAFCFALMNVLVRLSGDLPSMEKSFFRNFVALFFALALIYKDRVSLKIKKGTAKYLIIRSVCGTIGIFCNFYAIDHMAVADSSMLNKLSPFFIIIFSYFILKEKVTFWQGVFVLTAFLGTIFIIRPGFNDTGILPASLAVLGGMSAGLAYAYVRKLGLAGVKGPVIVFFFSAFSCIASVPFMLMDFRVPTLTQLITLLLTGLAAAGGQFGITAAYTYAPASEISIYDYSQIIFITLLSFALLGEIPDAMSFVGYAVICTASVLMFFYNKKRSLKKPDNK